MASAPAAFYSSASPTARFMELSKHRSCGMAWISGPCKRLEWGNQEPIWTLSQYALRAKPSKRIEILAQPKPNHLMESLQSRESFIFSCGRESSIGRIQLAALHGSPSERLEQLARPKRLSMEFEEPRPSYVHGCGCSTPINQVNREALACHPSVRVQSLAYPKKIHPDYRIDREVETYITPAARRARGSPRLEQLACPRTRDNMLFFSLGRPEEVIRPVSSAACNSTANPRTQELAKHKIVSKRYLPARDSAWLVSPGARSAAASPRTLELCKPISRQPMDLLQYNPDVFLVKEAAMRAKCSPRIQELSQPLQH
ncbi:testicular haploid expressed gene protein-like [Erpetoichthys calabaricus]|uniref:testicular haploid expressed gene protein-like n=1 Tax=Erpetoichthys calabaricus TaxID=27687 RepID=UPI002234C3BF|nr:testicular haploid expressed gene protein-like [Erpetoichthys calabaricus]